LLAYPNEKRPPLAHIPAALRERSLNETFDRLEGEGINCVGETPDGALRLDLSELTLRSGSVARGQQALYAALDSLNIARVDLSPGDVIAILGKQPYAWAVARAAESGIAGVANLLHSITPEEIFDRLEEAQTFVANDRVSDDDPQAAFLKAHYSRGAAADLQAHGMLDGPIDDSYAHFLEPTVESVPELPKEFQGDLKPWRSPFNGGH
jgi:hypothetical protein